MGLLGLKSRHRQSRSFWTLAVGENLFPGLFQLLETPCIPWFMAPSSVFKASNVQLHLSQAASL